MVVVSARSLRSADSIARQILGGDTPSDIELVVVAHRKVVAAEAETAQVLSDHAFVSLIIIEDESSPGLARNLGLERASGRWVAFIDDDDEVDVNQFFRLISTETSASAEVSGGSFWHAAPDSKQLRLATNGTLESCIEGIAGVWRFVFNRQWLLDLGIRFPDASYGEDLIFLLRVCEFRPRFEPSQLAPYTYLDLATDRLSTKPPQLAEVRFALDELLVISSAARASRQGNLRRLVRQWRWRIAGRNLLLYARSGKIGTTMRLAHHLATRPTS